MSGGNRAGDGRTGARLRSIVCAGPANQCGILICNFEGRAGFAGDGDLVQELYAGGGADGESACLRGIAQGDVSARESECDIFGSCRQDALGDVG